MYVLCFADPQGIDAFGPYETEEEALEVLRRWHEETEDEEEAKIAARTATLSEIDAIYRGGDRGYAIAICRLTHHPVTD